MNNDEFKEQKLEKKRRGIRNAKLKKKLGEECVYCKCNNLLTLTIDHTKPLSRGGEDNDENKQVTCFICNQLKDSLTDKEFKEYLKGITIMKRLNKMMISFNSKGEPTLAFYEKGYPQTLKELEEKHGNKI